MKKSFVRTSTYSLDGRDDDDRNTAGWSSSGGNWLHDSWVRSAASSSLSPRWATADMALNNFSGDKTLWLHQPLTLSSRDSKLVYRITGNRTNLRHRIVNSNGLILLLSKMKELTFHHDRVDTPKKQDFRRREAQAHSS